MTTLRILTRAERNFLVIAGRDGVDVAGRVMKVEDPPGELQRLRKKLEAAASSATAAMAAPLEGATMDGNGAAADAGYGYDAGGDTLESVVRPSEEHTSALLREHGPMTASEVAAQLGGTSSAVSRRLRQMEADGVVRREGEKGTPGGGRPAVVWAFKDESPSAIADTELSDGPTTDEGYEEWIADAAVAEQEPDSQAGEAEPGAAELVVDAPGSQEIWPARLEAGYVLSDRERRQEEEYDQRRREEQQREARLQEDLDDLFCTYVDRLIGRAHDGEDALLDRIERLLGVRPRRP